jgi:hypothetical protein
LPLGIILQHAQFFTHAKYNVRHWAFNERISLQRSAVNNAIFGYFAMICCMMRC